MRLIFLLLFTLNACLPVLAQDTSVVLSEPVDIPKEGWNKLLWMKNGNTMLLHFEYRKGIVVKIFDANHKEIAHQKHICDVLDINNLDRSAFYEFMECNGEAVLFVGQILDNRQALLRLRFDASSGKLLKEEKVFAPDNTNKKFRYYLLKNNVERGYKVLCFESGQVTNVTVNIKFVSFNENHEIIQSVPFEMKTAEFNTVALIGFELDSRDACVIALELSKPTTISDISHYLKILYLPAGLSQFVIKDFKLPEYFEPYGLSYTYNKFAGNLNLFLTTRAIEKWAKDKLSLDFVYTQNTLLVVSEDPGAPEFYELKDEMINIYLKEHKDDTRFVGSVLHINTNERGLTTIVSKNQNTFQGDAERKDLSKFSGYIGITQLDDHGKELWATVIPRSRYYKRVIEDLGREPFGMGTEYSLANMATYVYRNNFYILYNDLPENFDKNIGTPLSAIGNFLHTNTVIHHIGKKREINKKYLFGLTAEGEYKHAYMNSANFDEQTGKLAILMSIQKGDKRTTHIAWTQLGN